MIIIAIGMCVLKYRYRHRYIEIDIAMFAHNSYGNKECKT